MPTIKARINVTADGVVEEALARAAKRDHVPVATKAAELLRLALEIEEDEVWTELAATREKNGRFISHRTFWKKALAR
ncbi:MAG: toxin-antitoxin system, antitoxin component [Candidatus Vogelbacteria bacterium]|nr:toxin-antitoxin system, antitoxin component [Candidatus Vogelbacteria bacterium]